MKMFELTLNDNPPSDNTVYKKRQGSGKGMYLDQKGKDWKQYIQVLAYNKHPKITDKPIRVDIEITFPDKRIRDISNYDKLLLDSLTGIVYEDDSQITELRLRKKYGPEKQMKIKVDLSP